MIIIVIMILMYDDDDDDDDYRSHLSQQDFLSVAVAAPWARAISHNGVPYYIK